MARLKVLLDTDIGTDVDDALCLAYLLAQPECELLGITTVTGEPHKRAELASVLCEAAGKDIPIFPGAEKPLLVAQKQPWAAQALALERLPHRAIPQGQVMDAIQFMRRVICDNPGEINLLAIGALTNVGLLFSLDPQIPSLLKSLTMMAGNFARSGKGDWNTRLDPHASAIVYQSAVAVHRSVGKDVTKQVHISAAEARQRFTTGLLRPVLEMAEVFFREHDEVTFHDPLAAVTLFDENVCEFEQGSVRVELSDEDLTGKTHWEPVRREVKHEVALQVDPQHFFQDFFSVFAPKDVK